MVNKFRTEFIGEAVEKKPFADLPAQQFFGEWCRINDSIVPSFIPREEWAARTTGILEKNEDGKQTLFLPQDLHLWEIMEVIRTVDHDTLGRKPELRDERADQLMELGQTFEKAGQYLFEYLEAIPEDRGRDMAKTIAREFHDYGLSLQKKKRE